MANMDLLSYERDSRWMPHLSWTFPDWTLQEKMAQQAAQREQAWQKIADKLGPLLVGSDILNNALAAGTGGGGGVAGSFGQSDFIVRDIDESEQQERAYEKAPLLSANIKSQQINFAKDNQLDYHDRREQSKSTRNSYQSLNSQKKLQHQMQQHQQNQHQQKQYQQLHSSNPNYLDSIDSLRPSQSPFFSDKESQSSGIDVNFVDKQKELYQKNDQYLYQLQQQQQQQQREQQQYDAESFQKARRRCWTVSSILVLLVLLLFTLVTLMAFGVIQYKTFPRSPM